MFPWAVFRSLLTSWFLTNIFHQNHTHHFFPQCGGKLTKRDDDTEDIVKERLNVYQQIEDQVVPFFSDCGCLLNWEMKHGIADIPQKLQQTDSFISALQKK